jgi:pyrroline-5-carboxylate reductase
MAARTLEFLGNDTIGIIGCGNLGRTIAEKLLEYGFPKDRLKVSFGGSSVTYERIKIAGLLENISSNEDLCRESSIIFIALRPQAFRRLEGLSFPKHALVVSCMAGVSLDTLRKVTGADVLRLMPSGPETIRTNRGIVAIYPHSDKLVKILSSIGLRVYELPSEEVMHMFTVGACLPAALITAQKMGIDTERAIGTLEQAYPDFREIYNWAKGVLPDSKYEGKMDEYVKKMSTKGGVTEAIIESLNSGGKFYDALLEGIEKSKALSTDTKYQ